MHRRHDVVRLGPARPAPQLDLPGSATGPGLRSWRRTVVEASDDLAALERERIGWSTGKIGPCIVQRGQASQPGKEVTHYERMPYGTDSSMSSSD